MPVKTEIIPLKTLYLVGIDVKTIELEFGLFEMPWLEGLRANVKFRILITSRTLYKKKKNGKNPVFFVFNWINGCSTKNVTLLPSGNVFSLWIKINLNS